MIIRGEKVNLRTTEESDLPYLRSLWNHGPTMAPVGFPGGLRVTERGAWKWWQRLEQRQARAKYALSDDVGHMIIETKDGTPVGETGFSRPPVDDTVLVELKVHADTQRRGFGSDALRTLLRYAFDETHINAVVVEPAEENFAARALYEKLGFEARPRMVVLGHENQGLFMAMTRRRYREMESDRAGLALTR